MKYISISRPRIGRLISGFSLGIISARKFCFGPGLPSNWPGISRVKCMAFCTLHAHCADAGDSPTDQLFRVQRKDSLAGDSRDVTCNYRSSYPVSGIIGAVIFIL